MPLRRSYRLHDAAGDVVKDASYLRRGSIPNKHRGLQALRQHPEARTLRLYGKVVARKLGPDGRVEVLD